MLILGSKGVWELKDLGSLFSHFFFFVKQFYGLCLDKLSFLMKSPTLESFPQYQSIIKPLFSFLFLSFTSSFPSFLIDIFFVSFFLPFSFMMMPPSVRFGLSQIHVCILAFCSHFLLPPVQGVILVSVFMKKRLTQA